MASDNFLMRLARSTRLVPPVAEERFRPSLGLLAASSAAINLFALTIPIVMLITMDRILPYRAMDTMILLMSGAILAVVVESLLRMMRAQLTGWAGATFEHSTSLEVVSRLLAQPLKEFEGAGSGKHLEQFRKVGQLRQYFSGQSFTGWIDLPFSILYLLVMALVSWPLALVMVVGYGLFALYARRAATQQLEPSDERTLADQRRGNFLVEILSNIHTLKAMAMETLMLRRYDRLQERSARAIERQAKVLDESSGLASLFSTLLGTLVTALGAWLVIDGDLSRGELSACIFLVMRSLGPLQKVGMLWAKHRADEIAGSEVGELLEAPALADASGREPQLPADALAVEVSNVSFDYGTGGPKTIDNISFAVKQGGTLLIDGENGSGRSTLLGLIAGILEPNQGKVRLFGEDAGKFDRSQLNQLVGYLPQRATMYEGTLLQNATMFRSEMNDRARAVAQELGFADFILALPQGWETRVGDAAAESLPPGLRQRIGMIRALANDPPIILFDDATASVDVEGEGAIIAYLNRIKGQKTLILATHRPSLTRLADDRVHLQAPTNASGKAAAALAAVSTDTLVAKAEDGFGQLAVNSGRTYGDAFWQRLDQAVASAFRQPNDLSQIVAPLLREIGWRGEIRDVIEALPYFADELDISGLASAVARLGFKVVERNGEIAAIDDRGYPCLVLPDEGSAVLLLQSGVDGYIALTGIGASCLITENLGHGRALFFEPDLDATNPVQRWTRATLRRLVPNLAQAAGVSIIIGILMLALSLFTTLVFNQVLPTGATDLLVYALFGVLLALVLVAFLQRYRAELLAYLAGRVEFVFGTAAISKIMHLSPSYTERSSVGSQIARLSGFEAIRDLFTSPIAATVLELPATIIIAIVLCLINPVALPVILVSLIAYALLYLVIEPISRERVAAQGRLAARRNEFLVEMISKMRGIREGRAEQVWLERYRKVSADASFAAFRTEQVTAVMSSAAYLLMMAAGIAMIAFSIPGTFDGTVGAGALIASLILMWRVLGPMQALFNNLSRVGRVRAAAQQFDMLMQLRGERLPSEMRAHFNAVRGHIELSRVSFRYSMNADPAVVGVTLDLPAGSMTAVTGANGSGKSTLLKLLLGMYVPQAGTIRIDGTDLRQIDPVDLRRMIGYVPQETQFFRATIAQNLRFAQPDATDTELLTALEITGALKQVMELPGGLDYRIGDSASDQLPSSLRQKLVMARAYLTRAPILLFDEPSTGLDFESDACFIGALKALKGKRTVIFISHRPSHLKLADNVVLFRESYVQGVVPPATLFPATN